MIMGPSITTPEDKRRMEIGIFLGTAWTTIPCDRTGKVCVMSAWALSQYKHRDKNVYVYLSGGTGTIQSRGG